MASFSLNLSSEEKQLFLHDDPVPDTEVEPTFKRISYPSARAKSLRSVFYHSLLIAVYTAICVAITNYYSQRAYQCPSTIPSPSIQNLSLNYSPWTYTEIGTSPYTGAPGSSVDNAWADLMSKIHIRVTKEELERNGQTSIEMPGGGYLAWLGGFHELHCVKMLREWNYRDYYHPNLTLAQEDHMKSHADHCLEYLRSAAICHADTSLTTFHWAEGQERPMLNTTRPPHVCVNWDGMMESVSSRIIGEEEFARVPLLRAESLGG